MNSIGVTNNNKKILALMLMFVVGVMIFSTGVSAQLFSAEYEPVKSAITPDGIAEFDITIYNFQKTKTIYGLGMNPSGSANWIISPSSLTVPADTQETFRVKFFPKSNVGIGTYFITLNIRSSDGVIEALQIPIGVNIASFYQYQPDVVPTIVAPSKVDPREKFKIEVQVTNKNQLDVGELLIKVMGENDLFYGERTLSLGPKKINSTEIIFELNPLQKPDTYHYTVQIIYPKSEAIIAEAQKSFDVQKYSEIEISKSGKQTSWFLTKETITLENTGNYERTKDISVSAPWIKRIFMSTNPDAEIIKGDSGAVYSWNPSLKPTEKYEIVIQSNYRYLVIIIVLLVVLIVLYFVLRSPIIVLKEAAVVKEDDEGVSEIKVRIFLKNRARRTIHNISVSDKIPRITQLVPSHLMGSLKPTRVTTTSKKGTALYWDIDRLESYEERILTYRVTSQLKIVGNVSMPRAKAKFETSSGRERMIESGVPLFLRN